MVRANSQSARVLKALSNGRWCSSATLTRRSGATRLNSRISDLRKIGYEIEAQRDGAGAVGYRYRLLNPPSQDVVSSLVTSSPPPVPVYDRRLIPRDEDHRFRIYRMRYDELELVATAPSPPEVGAEIVSLGEHGAFHGSCIGILDTHGTDDEQGTWIVHPWDTQ